MMAPTPDVVSELGARAIAAGEIAGSEFNIVTVLGAGVLLALGLRLGRVVLDLVPMTGSRRELKDRAMPVFAAMAWLAYLLFVARLLFQSAPQDLPFVATAILAGVAVASWSAIRDLLNGVFIVSGRVCTVGDHIEVDDVSGRVAKIGLRVLTLETPSGDEAIIPYTKVARSSVRRSRVRDTAAAHVFRIRVPAGAELSDAKRELCEAVMCCHWSSVVREPEVALLDDDWFEVTAYALQSDRGPDIEAAVRGCFAQSVETPPGA